MRHSKEIWGVRESLFGNDWQLSKGSAFYSLLIPSAKLRVELSSIAFCLGFVHPDLPTHFWCSFTRDFQVNRRAIFGIGYNVPPDDGKVVIRCLTLSLDRLSPTEREGGFFVPVLYNRGKMTCQLSAN